jgi:excisionase family DNA binding protein
MVTTGRLLTVSETAIYLGRTEHFVRECIADGTLSARKIRGHWYLGRAYLDTWLTPAAGEGASGAGSRPAREVRFRPRRAA